MIAPPSPGKIIWNRLRQHLKAVQTGACEARERRVIWDVTPQGHFLGDMTLAAFLAEARHILRQSGQVYRWGDSVVYETRQGDDPQLRTLAVQGSALPGAKAFLANVMVVGIRKEETCSQSVVPPALVAALLADDDLARSLPVIRYYARRPVFDDNFRLCGPGWHADPGILVHGPDVTPAVLSPVAGGRAIDRLPPHLKAALAEFAWQSDADLINAVGFLLTGVLVNHFVDDPHPIGLADANQRGLGKSLLFQAGGRILDGVEPPRIPLVSDDELEKKLCTHLLHNSRCSMFFLDNVRTRIESGLLEQCALSPVLEFRILGGNTAINRPNNYLWAITSNLTSGTPDFISRALPIRLHYEGDPRDREFAGRPLEYATRHRLDILGELVGMVLYWLQQGRPLAQKKHRCERWAQVVGGILAALGLTEFLENVREAEEIMDEGLQDLGSLAEYVIGCNRADLSVAAGTDLGDKGAPAKVWAGAFGEAEVGGEQLQLRAGRSRDTWVGQFLAARVGRTVTVAARAGVFAATLRSRAGRANQMLYYLEVASVPEGGQADTAGLPVGVGSHPGRGEGIAPPPAAADAAVVPGGPRPSPDAAPAGEVVAPHTAGPATLATDSAASPADTNFAGTGNDLNWV